MKYMTLEWFGELFFSCLQWIGYSFVAIYAYDACVFISEDIRHQSYINDRAALYWDCVKIHPKRDTQLCVNEAYARFPTSDEIRLKIKEVHTDQDFAIVAD